MHDKLFELVKQSLIEGRILVSENQRSGSVLVSPENAVEEMLEGPSVLNHYLLTNDLPFEWFYSPESLPARRSKAIRWLENAEKELHSKGLRASKADYTNVMMKRFGLTVNATKDVWKQVNRIHKGTRGNFLEVIKAKETDLWEIGSDN